MMAEMTHHFPGGSVAATKCAIGLLIGVACLLCGCPSSERVLGEEGKIEFQENNNYYESGSTGRSVSLTEPIVVGGLLHVSVRQTDSSHSGCQLQNMETDDPEIVEYTGFALGSILEPDYNLRARSAGQTRLRATLTCDVGGDYSDSIMLRTREADSHTISLFDDTSFFQFGAKDTEGEALRPDTEVRVGVSSRAGSTLLIGIGGYALRSDESYVRVSKRFGDGDTSHGTVNTFEVVALGQSGLTELTTNLDGRLEFYTLSESDPLTLGVYDSLTGEPIDRVTDNLNGLAMVHIAAKDMGNRRVVPSREDKETFMATVSGGIQMVKLEAVGGAVWIHACPGTGELTATWFGETITVPVEITEGVDDPMCE
jgi:hypothetical protein